MLNQIVALLICVIVVLGMQYLPMMYYMSLPYEQRNKLMIFIPLNFIFLLAFLLADTISNYLIIGLQFGGLTTIGAVLLMRLSLPGIIKTNYAHFTKNKQTALIEKMSSGADKYKKISYVLLVAGLGLSAAGLFLEKSPSLFSLIDNIVLGVLCLAGFITWQVYALKMKKQCEIIAQMPTEPSKPKTKKKKK